MVALVAASVAAATAAGDARAQAAPSPSSSAVSQYTELVPTGGGPKAPGVEETELAALTPTARRALEGTPAATAKALATIATSSDYGAPKTTLDPDVVAAGGSSTVPGASLDRTFQAAASAASPVGDAYMIGLLLSLVVVTAGGAALAVRSRGADARA